MTFSGGLERIAQLVGARSIEPVLLNEQGDHIFRAADHLKLPDRYFAIGMVKVVGKAVVLKISQAGNFVSPHITLPQLQELVLFQGDQRLGSAFRK